MVQKPTNRNPLPEGNIAGYNGIDLTMPYVVEDYTETENPPLVVLLETLSPPSTLPPSPPPAPPSIPLSSSRSLRHHPYFTVTKASRQSSHISHSPTMFLQKVASPPLIVVHPPRVPVEGLPDVHVLDSALVLASS
ncbi:MAG: hypothetical protein JOS17DRAFT_774876 [Linnemannia elongata]|nr:MAG: hypothetical protein JOS17DRAFT_774876 [Linnemannia elongata]